jgi:hypothetical protein
MRGYLITDCLSREKRQLSYSIWPRAPSPFSKPLRGLNRRPAVPFARDGRANSNHADRGHMANANTNIGAGPGHRKGAVPSIGPVRPRSRWHKT